MAIELLTTNELFSSLIPGIELSSSPDRGKEFFEKIDSQRIATTRRFPNNGTWDYIMGIVSKRQGVVDRYGYHQNKDWIVSLENYLQLLRVRISKGEVYGLLQLELEYILKHLSNPTNSINSSLFQPELYNYHEHTSFPYRDQILNLEAIKIIGSNLLEIKRKDGVKVEEGIILNILNDATFIKSLESKISEERSHLFSKNERLSPEQTKFWGKLIRKAWLLISSLHEVGRVEHEEQQSRIFAGTTFSGILNARMVLDSQNHVYRNLHLLDRNTLNLYDTIDDLILLKLVIFGLSIEDRCLKNLGVTDVYSGCDLEEEWKVNPLGVLFITSLLIAELPARICWQSIESVSFEHGNMDKEQPTSFLPVQSVSLNVRERKLIFYHDTANNPPYARFTHPPLDDARLRILQTTLGGKCLGIFNDNGKSNIGGKWVPSIRQSKHQQLLDINGKRDLFSSIKKLANYYEKLGDDTKVYFLKNSITKLSRILNGSNNNGNARHEFNEVINEIAKKVPKADEGSFSEITKYIEWSTTHDTE